MPYAIMRFEKRKGGPASAMPPLLRNGSGKLMKGGRSKKSVNNSWHKNDRPVTIPPFVRPKEILWRERR